MFCQDHAIAPLGLKKSIWRREIPIDGLLGLSVFPWGWIFHLSIKYNGANQFVTAVSETAVFVAKLSLGRWISEPIGSLHHLSKFQPIVCISFIRCLHQINKLQGSHTPWKSWKTWKITKNNSMHGKIMEFEKTLIIMEKSWNFVK